MPKPNVSPMRPRPAIFRALGNGGPPAEIVVRGIAYRLHTDLKHDSWAATAIYADPGDTRIIAKFNRRQGVYGLPLAWLGRRLARREAGFLRRLSHLPQVPEELGAVTSNGKVLENACARAFVDGEAFQHAEQADAAFFRELREILDGLHAAGMAYVDLHKRENIIVDLDDRPHLIDFQVSYGLAKHWPGNGFIARAVLRRLQEMDDYHYRKHVLRCRPEMLTAEERETYSRLPATIRAHRRIAVPLRALRRRLLTALRIRDQSGQARSELEPEAAFRPPPAADAPPKT